MECLASRPDQNKGIQTFKAGLGKVHVRMGGKLRKKVEDSYQQFFFYFLFPFLYICSHSRDTPRSFAFTALDRMDGLGLGAFL
jgi:hypothetical protein